MSICVAGGYGSLSFYETGRVPRRALGDDPTAEAVGRIAKGDPSLAKKLQAISDSADALQESGASDREIEDAVGSAIDGLSDDEWSEIDEALGPLSDDEDEGAGDEDDAFDLSAFLDAFSSAPNDTIAGFLSLRSSTAAPDERSF